MFFHRTLHVTKSNVIKPVGINPLQVFLVFVTTYEHRLIAAKNINQLVEVLRKDPRFEMYAMQFSQSPSAANGGKLGWVPKGKMPAALEQGFVNLKEGGVSKAISYGDDYYIFKLEKVFNPSYDKDDMPTRQNVRKFLENKKLEEYATKYMKDLRNRALIEKKI